MQELTERRMLMAEARQAGIERLDDEATRDDEPRVVELLRSDAGFLGETLDIYGPDASIPQLESKLRLRRSMLDAERGAVLQARSEGRYQEPAVAAALQAIDAEETASRPRIPVRSPARSPADTAGSSRHNGGDDRRTPCAASGPACRPRSPPLCSLTTPPVGQSDPRTAGF